jgi:hypothetical protein
MSLFLMRLVRLSKLSYFDKGAAVVIKNTTNETFIYQEPITNDELPL